MGNNIMERSLNKFVAATQLDCWLKKRNSQSHDSTVLGRGRTRIPICKQANGSRGRRSGTGLSLMYKLVAGLTVGVVCRETKFV
jgi:hypothetical protein